MKIKYSFEQWCLDNGHQDWLGLWDYKNNNVGPENVAFKSHKKFWFKCPKDKHNSELKSIHSIVTNQHLVCLQCNSFGQWLLDTFGENGVSTYWSDNNELSPFSISKDSSQEIWIKCIVKGHPDYKTRPVKFRKGRRCAVCCNQKIILGINSIYDTHPELLKYFVNIEDAKQCSASSKHKCLCKCPCCGYEKEMFTYNLIKQGFCCPNCSDGISYPNKFMANVLKCIQLKQNNIEFCTEKTFEWSKGVIHENPKLCGNKRYDFYIKLDDLIIIECHGSQHYNAEFFNGTNNKKTLVEEQMNDEIKRNLAISNGVSEDRYVVINCSTTTMRFMKKSIMESNLPKLLDFNEDDVDWEKCERAASSSLLNQCCDLWNVGIRNITKISEMIGVSYSTVIRYLSKGSDIGLCDYQPQAGKRSLYI